MSEQIRSIEITITVDTTKRTFAHNFEAESLDDALEKFRERMSDIRWLL